LKSIPNYRLTVEGVTMDPPMEDGMGNPTTAQTAFAAGAMTSGPFALDVEASVTAEGQPIVCTLDADGGNMTARIGEWQAILAQASGRERTDDSVAVTFDHDIARTAELARLLAAEYSCCSFASYHLTIDARGVRMEVRTPPEARGVFDAVFGTAD